MDIRGIDHVEFYVGDARQAAFYLCTAFGFQVCGQGGPETGLEGQRSLLLRQGHVAIVLTSGLYTYHPATRYVARHGDGVAIIAFEVGDVDEAYREAVERGATSIAEPNLLVHEDGWVKSAVVSGFGDVAHRFIQRSGDLFMPNNIAETDPPVEISDKILRVIDHAAIVVPAGELDVVVKYYEDVFGFNQIFEEYIEVGGQGMDSKVVQSPSKGVTFTLIEPDLKRKPGQIDDFLRWHAGAGVQHLAFLTDDIVAAVDTLADRGVAFLRTPNSYYDTLRDRVGEIDTPVDELQRLGVLVDRDEWGQMLQIFTQSMHVRRTLFLEIIERRGALTFGSGNIKALYQAKQRELA